MKQKPDVNKYIQKANEQLDLVKQDDVDLVELRTLINEAIAILRKSFRSGMSAKEKRDKALAIVNKYMPSGMNVTHEVGDSFIDLIKDINKNKPKKKKK